MAMTVWPVDAVTGAPSYTGRLLRQGLGVLVGGGTSARPLIGGSGVNPRTPSTTVAATSTTVTVHPHGGHVDAEVSASAGGYFYTSDADWTASLTPADASHERIDLVWVQISDPAETDGSSTPGAAFGYTAGVADGSLTVPSLPSRSMPLATIDVPQNGHGSPTVTWTAPNLTAAGGIQPTPGSAGYPGSPRVGQYIDDAVLGLLRWDGTAWRTHNMNAQYDVTRSITLHLPSGSPQHVATYDGSPVVVGTEITLSAGIATVHRTGWYGWYAEVLGTAVATVFEAYVEVNGSITNRGRTRLPGSTAHQTYLSPYSRLRLSAGDTVQLVCQSLDTDADCTPLLFGLKLDG